jgi:4'-phosphopantetheinyl transferase EntD
MTSTSLGPPAMALLAALLPPRIAVTAGDVADHRAELWPEEAARIGRAVESRRREFAAGRALARRALAQLGAPVGPIAASEQGGPAWPSGFVGSITHTAAHSAAIAARRADFAGLGIDMEEPDRFQPELYGHILTAAERGRMADLAAEARQAAAALAFSAKESFYKLQHPLTAAWLGFEDAEIVTEPARSAFRVVVLGEGPAADIARRAEGGYAVTGALVATAMWLAP